MEEHTNIQDVHALIRFYDILGNAYYMEFVFSEDETQHIDIVLKTLTGKIPFEMLPEQAKDLSAKILTLASDTIANACMNDFDRATKLLVAVRKQNLNEDINDKISIAIRNIAELKQLAPPFAISSDKAYESIITAFKHMPPLRGIFIKTFNQLKWDYLNKRRIADYGNCI